MAYDLLIRNAAICDGTGAPVRGGALAVSEGKIAAMGDVGGPARREIDADGAVLAPGFIDIHTHFRGTRCSPARRGMASPRC